MIWELIARVTSVVADNPWLATGVAFLAAVIEAVAVLGMLLPGTGILMAVAGAAAMAGLSMTPILAAAVVGAVLGDGVSFWLGRRYNDRIRRMWPFATRPGLMESAEQFFERYGTMSVALCRFVPVLRSTVPLVAGMAGMAKCRFLIANIGSALVWAPAHVYPAQFAGLSIDSLETGDWRTAALWGSAVLATAIGLFALHRLGPHGLKVLGLFLARPARGPTGGRTTDKQFCHTGKNKANPFVLRSRIGRIPPIIISGPHDRSAPCRFGTPRPYFPRTPCHLRCRAPWGLTESRNPPSPRPAWPRRSPAAFCCSGWPCAPSRPSARRPAER